MIPGKRPIALTAVSMLAVFFFWISCAEAQGNAVKKVRLTYSGWGIGTAVAYVGIDAGIFKKYDLDVEEVFLRDALSGGLQALIGVDFVLGFGNSVAMFQPILGGTDIVFLGSHVSMEQSSLVVSSNINTIKELKGKKIGVSGIGQRSDLIARVLLRRAGLDPVEDVEMVSAGFSPSRVVALSKNLIQASPITPEVASEAKKLGLKVLEVKDVPLITGLLMTTRTVIKKDEEAVRRFMKGYLAAIQYYLAHKDESIAIIRKYFPGADPRALETMYEEFAAQLSPIPAPNGEALQALIDSVSATDRRAKGIKPVDLFDSRFLEELKKSRFVDDLYTEKVSL